MTSFYRAIKDPTRRAILELLKEHGQTAGQISSHFELTKATISHHLDLLKRADLLEQVKLGQFVYYSLKIDKINDCIKWLEGLKRK